MRFFSLALLLSVAVTSVGCVDDLLSRGSGYDQRQLTIETASLFNQRMPTRLARKSWRGDWLFRRDRLELVDDELRDIKPDIFIAQEVMAKRGSASESDLRILKAGALSEYDFKAQQVIDYPDTDELESLVVAIGTPLKFSRLEAAEGERELWVMGNQGYLMVATIDVEDQPVTVFNVQMPPQEDNSYLWYSFIQERIAERLKRFNHCPKRVVVAGLLPGDEGAKRFSDFVAASSLKDVSAGYCQTASRCFTSTPTNDIFMATIGDETPARNDRIFVHQSAYVYSSARDLDRSDSNSRYAREFGLTRLWPSQRFGWVTTVRLARCTEDELL